MSGRGGADEAYFVNITSREQDTLLQFEDSHIPWLSGAFEDSTLVVGAPGVKSPALVPQNGVWLATKVLLAQVSATCSKDESWDELDHACLQRIQGLHVPQKITWSDCLGEFLAQIPSLGRTKLQAQP